MHIKNQQGLILHTGVGKDRRRSQQKLPACSNKLIPGKYDPW